MEKKARNTEKMMVEDKVVDADKKQIVVLPKIAILGCVPALNYDIPTCPYNIESSDVHLTCADIGPQ